MLEFIKENVVENHDNRITLSGVGEDMGISFLVSDEDAQKVLDILSSYVPQQFSWGGKSATKRANKALSTDGVFEYRAVNTAFGTAYQIRIVPRDNKTKLDGRYASKQTAKIKALDGIVDFRYTASNGTKWDARGFKTEAEAKKAVETLNNAK